MVMSVNEATDLLKNSVGRMQAEIVLNASAEGELLRGIKDLIAEEQAAGFADGVTSMKAAIKDASAVVADVIARAQRLKDQLDGLAQ
jgi:ribosomal protein L22